MAVTQETLRTVMAMRLALSRQVDASTRALSRQWAVAWQEIVDEFQQAADELVDMIEDGRWPPRTKVLRAQHAANAIKAAVEAMQELADQTGVQLSGDLPGILDLTEHWSERIVGTQLPYGYDLSWARVDKRELETIVRRTTQQIHSATRPLPKIVEQRMKATLIRGVAVGSHPDVTARLIVSRSEGVFNGGLARATNIARTELIDASRGAALASRQANADVVTGWRWHCDAAANTCPSCIAQDGELHPASDPGPFDHPQGRCTALPVTASWRDLGIDMDEPEDTEGTARDWFAKQPESTQLQIMGRKRLDAFNQGKIGWSDMSRTVHNPGWRDSVSVAPLPASLR